MHLRARPTERSPSATTTSSCSTLVFTVGQYHLVSMALNTFRVERDDGVTDVPIPDALSSCDADSVRAPSASDPRAQAAVRRHDGERRRIAIAFDLVDDAVVGRVATAARARTRRARRRARLRGSRAAAGRRARPRSGRRLRRASACKRRDAAVAPRRPGRATSRRAGRRSRSSRRRSCRRDAAAARDEVICARARRGRRDVARARSSIGEHLGAVPCRSPGGARRAPAAARRALRSRSAADAYQARIVHLRPLVGTHHDDVVAARDVGDELRVGHDDAELGRDADDQRCERAPPRRSTSVAVLLAERDARRARSRGARGRHGAPPLRRSRGARSSADRTIRG